VTEKDTLYIIHSDPVHENSEEEEGMFPPDEKYFFQREENKDNRGSVQSEKNNRKVKK
jgi:hypothetical protein